MAQPELTPAPAQNSPIMVYYEDTDVFAPEDDKFPPRCHSSAFQDDPSSVSGVELLTKSRTPTDVEMVDIYNALPAHHAQPALKATVLAQGRTREIYVKRHSDGRFTDMYGTPIVINPPHNAPLPIASHVRRAPDSAPNRPFHILERGQQHGISRSTPIPLQPTTSAQETASLFPPRAKPMPTPPSFKIKLGPPTKGITTDDGVKLSAQSSGSRKRKSRGSNGQVGTKQDGLITANDSLAKRSLIVKLKVKCRQL